MLLDGSAPWFSTGGQFCPPGTLGNVWRYFCVSRVEVALLASSGQRPGMLLQMYGPQDSLCKEEAGPDGRGAKVEASGPSWWCPLEYFPSFPVSG